jgi:ABC-type nickel/cobalt efflux system permease component RcnA
MRIGRRLLALLAGTAAVLVALLGAAAPASAHPLGNFTVNRYARVEVSAGVARVHYVLDLAEIPAFQARQALEADPAGYADAQVREILAELRLEVDGRALSLAPVDRRLTRPGGEAGLSTVRLAVLFEASLPEAGPEEVLDARFADSAAERIGWREIVVVATGDAEVVDATVASSDVSDALRSYPEGRLRSPLDVRQAAFRFTTGDEAVAAGPLVDGPTDRPVGDRFTRLLDRRGLTPFALAGMLGVAALVGVGHALAPGHGKTVMAAYLIGTRGRPLDAVALGVIVSVMHTTSVLVLGAVLYQLDERFALDEIYPVLTLASGVGVLAVGAWLAMTRAKSLARWRPGIDPNASAHPHPHPHPHDGHGPDVDGSDVHHGGDVHRPEVDSRHHPRSVGAPRQGGGHAAFASAPAPASGGALVAVLDQVHDEHLHAVLDHAHHEHVQEIRDAHDKGEHDAGHAHDDEHARSGDSHVVEHHHHGPGGHRHDLPEGVAPLSRRGLLLLATAGGVVPSPSAVIVLVSAFTLGRAGLGLALVAAFSIGLAVTLTSVGLALVVGSRAFGRRVDGRLVRLFPVLGAVALVVLGLVLTAQGIDGL